ncbi:MAG TPA: response regulator transcription factor [Thermoanaerobaculia bacterium]|nr:response regulator transcription factor [Thermoanaerobaculia bacterium]
MSEKRSRALLADDQPVILAGLRKLLEPGLEVVATVTDGRELLTVAERLRPDLVITEISMPGLDGIEALRRLQEALPGTRVLVLSFHTEPCWIRAVFAAGARGYLTKTSTPEEIDLAVREVLKGHFFVSPAVTWAVLAGTVKGVAEPSEKAPATAAPVEEPLTRREADIAHLVGQGLSNKDIAQQLGLSVTTVRSHLNRIYEKLGTASRVELALFAAQGRGAVM